MQRCSTAQPNPNRRDELYTFVDANNTVFTVTNLPDNIDLPTAFQHQPDETMRYQDILRPQFAYRIAPELGFVLRTIPINDPLLGRLGVDDAWLYPVEFNHRFGLHDDIRLSWWQLEKALLHISNILISLANSDESKVLYRCTFWKEPSECGYRRLHTTHSAAEAVIRKSRTALAVLAARCSMGIALWLDDHPVDVPTWVHHLRKNHIPEGWIDLMLSSVITSFAHGLRVGVVVPPDRCEWTRLLTCYRRARVPCFVRWHNLSFVETYKNFVPYLCEFAPSEQDMRFTSPPRPGAPHIFLLCRNGQGRPHPYDAKLEDILARPAGQFQRPGESFEDFSRRMKVITDRIIARETPSQRASRRARERAAEAKGVPPSSVRVYVWLKVLEVFPDCPYEWRDLDYRVLALPSQYHGLWATHPPTARSYNPVFNEWDLCMRQGIGLPNMGEKLAREPARIPEYQSSAELYTALENDLDPPQYPTTLLRAAVEFKDNWLYTTYGLVPSTTTYPGVDYRYYQRTDLHKFFGLINATALTDQDEVRKVYAGWVRHMEINHKAGTATADCWDLHYPSAQFLVTAAMKRKVLVQNRTDVQGNSVYEVRYADDPTPLPWVLIVKPLVLAELLRHFPSISSSIDAVMHCIAAGCPFHTVCTIRTSEIPQPYGAREHGVRAPVLFRYGERSADVPFTRKDYVAYRIRALAMLGDTQIRAALCEGGIIWRTTTELLAADEGLYQQALDLCAAGPVLHRGMDTLVDVLPPRNGFSYLDNAMTGSEADVLCGMYLRYCGRLTSHFEYWNTTNYSIERGEIMRVEELSWWPKPSHWTSSGFNTTIWNPWNEDWFQNRVEGISNGTVKPKRAEKWRSSLRLIQTTGDLASAVERASDLVLQKHI